MQRSGTASWRKWPFGGVVTVALGLESQVCQAEEATGAGRHQGAGGDRLDLSRAKGTRE